MILGKRMVTAILIFQVLVNCCFGQDDRHDIKLSNIFGDNMVLQRNKPINFWGTAPPDADFSIVFANKTEAVKADAAGNWQVLFPAQKAGSVFELKVVGSNTFSYKNILMGDVWLTSGQSNMDFKLGDTDSVMYDIADNDNIRFVITPTYTSNYPQKDVRKYEWQFCNKLNEPSFSAVSYYFAQKLNKETGVPIGIINSSWGGTSIKAWTSEKGIAHIPEYKALLDTFLSKRYTHNAIDSINARNGTISGSANNHLIAADKGYAQQWQKGNKGDAVWTAIELPGTWKTGNQKDFNGVYWFRKEIELPADVKDEQFCIYYGRIWGVSEMYINGVKVGSNGYYKSENRFYIKPNILLPGKNKFVIRVVDTDTAALFQGKASDMVFKAIDINHPVMFSIAGTWEATTTLTAAEVAKWSPKIETAPPNTTVSSIFNVKINPLLPLGIKGVLWYQGENDAAVAFFYRTLFKNMITDWRQQFRQGKLPFIFAQLPIYGRVKNEPVEKNSEWAEIRESQADALSLPNTGMAVTLELGDPNNIHPHNKKPVGERMANAAMKMEYGFKAAPQSPLLKAFKIKGNEIHVYFTNVGTGVSVRNGDVLKGFAIAGADKIFVWGDVKIVGKDEIVVSAPTIKYPVSVRYAWASSPVDANLINKEGLPAAPFRTDDWPLTTLGKIDN